MSHSKVPSQVLRGQRGAISQIDKDGDFLIRFEDHAERQWILKRYIYRVRPATSQECREPLRPPPAKPQSSKATAPPVEGGVAPRSITVSSCAAEHAVALAGARRVASDGEWVGALFRATAVSPGSSRLGPACESATGAPSQVADPAGLRGLLMSSVGPSSMASGSMVSERERSCSAGDGVLAGLMTASLSSSLASGAQHVEWSEARGGPPLVLRGSSQRRGFYPLGESAVWLHIYDVSGSTLRIVNNLARPVGTGAFHAGVEVFGQEWSFGYAAESRTGIYNCRPRCNTAHKYRESLPMGVTSLSEAEVRRLIEALKAEWPGCSYDLLIRNCCHFSDSFCRALGVGPTPEWVTNLAGAGARIVGGVDQAVASAHAARGLVMAIDEHYQISPAVEALLTREFEMVDEDYVRQKAQDLWSSAVEALAPVGDLAGTAMASAAKAITLEGISEGFRGLWTQDATEPPAWEQQGARVVRAGMLRGPMDDDDDISPWSSGAQSPAGAGPAKRLEPSFAKPGRAHEADDFPKAEDSEPEVTTTSAASGSAGAADESPRSSEAGIAPRAEACASTHDADPGSARAADESPRSSEAEIGAPQAGAGTSPCATPDLQVWLVTGEDEPASAASEVDLAL